jgi:delta24-sterol reductase
MDAHTSAVQSLSTQIRQFHTTNTPFRIYHGSTNSTRHLDFDPSTVVDVSCLNHILSIDFDKQTALVEPNVPMDQLVQACLEVGLLPPVVMEFPGITVGGGFVGTAGESSSFKHGMFDRSVLSAEVVLADGRIVRASPDENAELFEGLRGSFGTLGVLTLVEVRLVLGRSYVEVTYYPATSSGAVVAKLEGESRKRTYDYLDGVLFGKEKGVAVCGRLVDASTKTNVVRRFSRPWDQWFYLHAETLASKSTPTVELVPVEDYLFR